MKKEKSLIEGCNIVDIPTIIDNRGSISFVEYGQILGFIVKRVYWLYNLKLARGAHAHKDLQQLIVCLHGKVDFILNDGSSSETITLDTPNKGIYITKPLWRDITNLHNNPQIMVLASEIYTEEDYIRSYEEFVKWKFHS